MKLNIYLKLYSQVAHELVKVFKNLREKILNGEIMPEDFVQIWDYWSNFDIYCDWNVDIKKKLSDWALWKFSDDVFVIDRDWREFFLSNDNKKKIEQRINNNNKKILFLD